jgi:TRAP transporter TAXI family solute receptor
MKKLFSFLLVGILVIGVVAGCSSSNETTGEGSDADSSDASSKSSGDNPVEGKVVTILTGGTSGVYFPLGNALAKVYNEELGAQASAQTTGASAVNSAKVAQKKAEVAFAMADTVSDAYNGVGKYKESGALENLRAVSALYTNFMQIVAPKGSGIESIEDLKGKKVAVGAPGSGTEIMAKRVLEAAGMTYDDIDEDFLSFKEGVEGIKNGVTDAAFLVSGLPNAGIMELATTEDVTLIPVSGEIVTKLQEIYPAFISETIPAGTYDGVDKDIQTAAVKNLLITHADVSKEEAYALTKAFYENIQVLRDTHNAANGIKLEKATEGLPIPLHPGAEKYFEEEGVLK